MTANSKTISEALSPQAEYTDRALIAAGEDIDDFFW
jgi:hypothetical protein